MEDQMKAPDLDKLEREVAAVIEKIDTILGKRAQRTTLENDDDNEGDDINAASNPSLEAGDNDDNHENNVIDDDQGEDEDDDQEEDEDDNQEEDEDICKLVPTTTRPRPTEFDKRVEFVRGRDGISKIEAMSRAREEFPGEYQRHQRFHSDDPILAQSTRRASFGKSAPVTFEDLVEIEIRKGCNESVAAQRVVTMYGSAVLRDRLSKRATDIKGTFADVTAGILDTEDCSRTEALRKARLSNPRLFKALQDL
jgi:hypothetical protein